jgi:hypothetical protein
MAPDILAVATTRTCVFRSVCWMATVFLAPCVHAEEPAPVVAVRPDEAPNQTFTVPGTSYEIVAGASQLAPGSTVPAAELISAVAIWLTKEFDFQPAAQPPRIQFASQDQLSALRYVTIMSEATFHPGDTVAVYNNRDGTIYLPLGWTGNTPAELSALVHEMVHHLQHEAGLTFACGEAREAAAYEAQQRWLAMFGRDLFEEFEIDAFTLLVRTNCGL